MYDREKAVQYANTWWDHGNPKYPYFENDCANYVSQCLRAGGAPMWGAPNREEGWWIDKNQWSFSWSTAHSLRWYLASSTQGLTATIVSSPEQLEIGDVILYDFENDGRFDHSAIVTKKVAGEVFVNAHTINVKERTWDYEDSPASTDQMRYLFFHINDRFVER